MSQDREIKRHYPKSTRREFGALLGAFSLTLITATGKTMASKLSQSNLLTLEASLQKALRAIGSDVTMAAADNFASSAVSSSILNLDGTKADSGWHFWAQAEYINGAGAGKMASLKGKVKRDVTGGHYFLGSHSGNCNIDVGGNVDISAIFIQAEGCQLIDLNVDGKINKSFVSGKNE